MLRKHLQKSLLRTLSSSDKSYFGQARNVLALFLSAYRYE
jgi:hypothetical protein